MTYQDMTIVEKRVFIAKVQHALEKSTEFFSTVSLWLEIEKEFGTFEGVEFYPEEIKTENNELDTKRDS